MYYYVKRHCVCCVSALCSAVMCVCVCVLWLSSWLLVTMNELCVYGSPWLAMARHGSSRHSAQCIACKMVSKHPKSSLSQPRNRADAITTAICGDNVAILVEKSDDFCYNRDEKRPKKEGFCGHHKSSKCRKRYNQYYSNITLWQQRLKEN